MTAADRSFAAQTEIDWPLGDGAVARLFGPDDAAVIFRLIDDNRSHLDRWLRWSNSIQTRSDVEAMLAAYQISEREGGAFHCGIWVGDDLAGGVVCRHVDPSHRNAEIGYWLGAAYTGRGLATRAAAQMTDYLFRVRELHRVEMQCGIHNVRSRAIPERLGYRLEGIRRESHWVATEFTDHAVYGILDREWRMP